MSLRLYRLACECPACGKRPAQRWSEAEVIRSRAAAPNEITGSIQCMHQHAGRMACRTQFWVRGRAWHNAVMVEEVYSVEGARETQAVVVRLDEREAAICRLVVAGAKDAKIVLSVGVTPRALRRTLGKVAARLRQADPSLPAVRPRATIAAYFAGRARPQEVFAKTA